MADWTDYFTRSRPPSNLEEAKRAIQDFASKHRQLGRNVVLVTSGGTTVPLESNTVRFVDNFSQGTRGALSAEYFLQQGYAVIFLHRQRSLEPFCRHFEGHNALDILDLEIDQNGSCCVSVDESRAPGLQEILRRYKEVQNACLLLQIGFLTLSDYLFLLRASAEVLSPMGPNAMFYLAAAVSDFYIPESDLAEHKIQSNQGCLQLTMHPTPKLLTPLVKEWAKNAFVVSFKLETDVNIISRKAREALQKYNHQVVIANVLQTRRKTVVLVTLFDEYAIWMAESEIESGKEIEEKIVIELIRRHSQFIEERPVAGQSDESNLQEESVVENTLSPELQFQNDPSVTSSTTHEIQSENTPQLIGNAFVANQLCSQSKNLFFQVGPAVTQTVPTTPTVVRRSLGPKDDHGLTDDMLQFIKLFKNKRMALGYTQEDVGRELSEMNGPSYSQSFISRFEGKQLGMKAAERMRQILEAFIQQKEEEGTKNIKYCKKRRRRTCFSAPAQQILNDHFNKNPRPSQSEMQVIAEQIDLDVNTVKVWFCNRKQSCKRQGQPLPDNTVKGELEARRKKTDSEGSSDSNFQTSFSLPSNQVKQLLSNSPSSISNLPFILSQDGVAIVTSPNPTQGSHLIPHFLTSSMSQQVVLSHVPFVPTVSVVSQGISGVVSVSGVPPGQVLATRQIPTQVLYQNSSVNSASISGRSPNNNGEETSQNKSDTDVLLANQFSSPVPQGSDLSGVSPSMITHSISTDIDAGMEEQTLDNALRSDIGQHENGIQGDSVAVVSIDDEINDSDDASRVEDSNADETTLTKR